jgi:hypothetical protein
MLVPAQVRRALARHNPKQDDTQGCIMPEGPSLVILKEQTARFVGQEIVRAEGITKRHK